MNEANLLARWVRGGYARQYDWPQCRYCGRAQQSDCRPVDCLACDSRVCHGAGFGRGNCPVCLHGYLPGWGRSVFLPDRIHCGYKGCDNDAVTNAPRVGQVCRSHIGRPTMRLAGRTVALAEYIAARVAKRDSGQGTPSLPGWRWVE